MGLGRTSCTIIGLATSAFVAMSSASWADSENDDLDELDELVVTLYQSDFDDGTLQITESGTYILAEDISFNPHPAGSLADDGVTVLDAYTAGRPFMSQFGATEDGKYDPAAFGIGFFAAIAISATNVTLDLNGHTLSQHPEHALLQRFFAVVELADQPFVPAQGPSSFGDELIAAERVTIKNGTIGLSSHHGIHGNGAKRVTIEEVDFVDFEVAAVALNGVDKLEIDESFASNREDVPVIGTFSNARFISAYVDWLVQTGSPTTLTVQGMPLSAGAIQSALRASINAVHEDVIVDGLGFIDGVQHPAEYALYHNKFGVVDGNSYGFLVNPLGVAVGGFPSQSETPSRKVRLTDVHILSQRASVNEVVAINVGTGHAKDPVGAVFMVRNTHPSTGVPLTTSSLDETVATYTGNVLANAQALVAKAKLNGEFASSFLNADRSSITQEILDWIENTATLDTLISGPSDYLCNGDTMFHVNKGVIGFKMDGVENVKLQDTSASNLENLGSAGSADCGNYVFSHPGATFTGYGGATVRGYSFAGALKAKVKSATAQDLSAAGGSVIGFDVLTDSEHVRLTDVTVQNLEAGSAFAPNGGPNADPDAIGIHIGPDTQNVEIKQENIDSLTFGAFGSTFDVLDESN